MPLGIGGVRSPRQLWWTVAELWPIGPGMLDLGVQESGSVKEWSLTRSGGPGP